MNQEINFREYPQRYLAFANQVGNAFKHTQFYLPMYGLSAGYVSADILKRTYKQYKFGQLNFNTIYIFLESVAWNGIATDILPAGFILGVNQGVKILVENQNIKNLLDQNKNKLLTRYTGLFLLPFLCPTFDKITNYLMAIDQ